MTTGLVILGVCHIVTALGLRPARPPGRFLLALGGVATLLVAAFPLPVEGTPASHILPAAVSFIVLSVWPLAACVPRAGVTVLGVRASAIATLTMLALLVTFAIHRDDSSQVGLFERILAATQALWPAATVLALLLAGRLMTRSHYLP
jgi:hypothetical membrane protein